jgi:hypothetical protein
MISTIIYYSANIENPVFESKIIDNLKKQAGDNPIISVTRKPMDLGKNICVGETPVCYTNSFRQLLRGLKEATTDFCIAAESDVLYPKDYFTFAPPLKDKPYRYVNVWVHFDGRDKFWKKEFSEGAQMCGTKHWIESIEKVVDPSNWDLDTSPTPIIFPEGAKYAWTGKPAITFKTRQAPHFKTGYQKVSVKSLPYWGTEEEVRCKYLNQ